MPALRRLFSISVAVLALSFGTPFVATEAREFSVNGVSWNSELSKGLESARRSNKYVLADVYTDWCGWCKQLDKTTFADPAMTKYLNEKFVCVKLNAEDKSEGQQAAEKNGVTGYPCALVYNSSGKLIGRISGYMKAKEYQAALEDILNKPQ